MTNRAYAKTMEMDFCVVFCGAVVGELDILTPEMVLNFTPELWCRKFYYFFFDKCSTLRNFEAFPLLSFISFLCISKFAIL